MVDARKKLDCKGCGKSFTLLLSHLKSKSGEVCREAYGAEGYARLLERSKEKRNERIAKWESENKAARSQKKSEWASKNREKIRESETHPDRKRKKAEWESENKTTRSQMKAKWASKNKEKIRESENQPERKKQKAEWESNNRQKRSEAKKATREKRKLSKTTLDRIKAFKNDIIHGPNYTCFSCKRQLFRNSIRILDKKGISKLVEKLNREFLKKIGLSKRFFGSQLTSCINCLKLIRSSKLPRIHVSNGLKLDKVPSELELTDLEQQLIARSLIFMKIKKLPKTRMKAVFDKVISVPVEEDDVSKTISLLPRHPDDAKIVAVQLKRKIQMKNSHLEENIRPAKCIKAVEKLREIGNQFYQDVYVNENFMDKEMVR